MGFLCQSQGFPPLPIPQNPSTGSENKNEHCTQMHSYNKKKPSKPRKKPTQARQILLLQSRRLGTTHIFVIVGKKFGCLRRSLPARYAALVLSHPSCPLPPGMGVALSLQPDEGAWGRGVWGWAGLCVGGGEGREQAAL